MQAELGEVIRALNDARERFLGIEHLPDTEQIRASLEAEVGCENGKASTADDSVERLSERT
jgi:low affinity Fe/Cu permease